MKRLAVIAVLMDAFFSRDLVTWEKHPRIGTNWTRAQSSLADHAVHAQPYGDGA